MNRAGLIIIECAATRGRAAGGRVGRCADSISRVAHLDMSGIRRVGLASEVVSGNLVIIEAVGQVGVGVVVARQVVGHGITVAVEVVGVGAIGEVGPYHPRPISHPSLPIPSSRLSGRDEKSIIKIRAIVKEI